MNAGIGVQNARNYTNETVSRLLNFKGIKIRLCISSKIEHSASTICGVCSLIAYLTQVERSNISISLYETPPKGTRDI